MTDDRIVKDARGADDGSRPGLPPDRTLPGPHLAADQGARQPSGCPAPHSAGAETIRQTYCEPGTIPRPGFLRGGRRPVGSLVRYESEWANETPGLRGRENLGGEPAAGPPRGGAVPTSISPEGGSRCWSLP